MCGIFGVCSTETIIKSKAREALNTLEHRGPDQWNEYTNERIYLGHRRLSILDLSENGKQPMIDANHSVVIAVNGEIYNFLEIKNQLIHKYNFKSTSDSEVVLYAYIEWGIETLLDKIDGMYMICIYDMKKEQVLLVRDRTGIKPLYFAQLSDKLIWASELKAIEKYLFDKNLQIDYTALYDFFTYQYIPTPKTLYKEVKKLAPGHYIVYDIQKKKLDIIQYWKLDVSNISVDKKTALDTIYSLVSSSVKEQMISDVPVGFFLSGGMDSSVIVGLASHFNDKIKTFTISFENNPKDESHYAKLVADHFNTEHTNKLLKIDHTQHMFHKIKEWYDEPFADLSCFPTYLVSQIAREDVTVVLTGDGGDEIFGGYKWYMAFQIIDKYNLRKLKFLQAPIKKLIDLTAKFKVYTNLKKRTEWLFLDELELYTRLMGGKLKFEKKHFSKLWNIPEDYDDYWYFRKYYKNNLPVITRLQYLDFHTYLPDDILTKVDRTSMAVSLECRVPFLSRKIIEYMFSLPENIRLPNGVLKGAMKKTFKKILPEEILKRQKEGFNIPSSTWNNDIKLGHSSRFDRILKDVFYIKY